MDTETQQRLFEPFYTTRGLGHGTGLGMASVEGIVRQNNGAVTVQSAVGRGTTVSVFLPREIAAVTPVVAVATEAPAGGTETVLVVDDEPGLLRLAVRTLEMRGYTVLTAASPDDALAMVRAHRGPLDILVTDIVMPGMNGWDLAERLVEALPALKCLYMSAYTNGVMGDGEKIREGVHFLQKPFSPNALAAEVRRVLEA
jgi:CheY-like chemotaxis protein